MDTYSHKTTFIQKNMVAEVCVCLCVNVLTHKNDKTNTQKSSIKSYLFTYLFINYLCLTERLMPIANAVVNETKLSS